MGQLAADSFDDVPGTDLLVHNINWAPLAGATGTTSIDAAGTRLRQTSTSTGTTHFYRSDAIPASADYSVSSDVFVSLNTGTGATGVVGRSSSTVQTFYQARVLNGTGVQLLRVIGGTATTLGTFAMTLANNQIVPLKLEMSGSTINVYVNGSATPDISVTDANIADVGYPGVRFLNLSSGQLRLDNFSADEGGAAAVTGTLATTLADAALSSAGQIINAGSFNTALNSFTMVSSGNIGVSPSGSMSASLGGAVFAAAGIANDSGVFASAMAGVSMASSGSVAPHASGNFAATLGGASMSAVGYEGDVAPVAAIRAYRLRILRRHFTN